VNTANNQIVGQSYDANGNTTTLPTNGLTYNPVYDGENRETSIYFDGTTLISYFYDAQNRRIWSWPGTMNGSYTSGYTVNAYSTTGQKLGAYSFVASASLLTVTLSSSDQYFGSRRLAVVDQLGSAGNGIAAAGTYYPWGELKGSTNPQDTWSYATYWRDSATGLDYANNRYYSNAYGRFMTPDPYKANGGGPGSPGDPQGWNRYAYTRGDPVNRADPGGMDDCSANTCVTVTGTYSPLDYQTFTYGNGYYGASQIQGLVQQATQAAQAYLPKTPSGFSYNGFSQALSDLNNPQCASLIAGTTGLTSTQLAGELAGAQVTTGTSAPGNGPVQFTVNPDGTWSDTWQWAYTSGGNIQLNANFFPDPTAMNIALPNGQTTSFLNLVNDYLGSGSSLNAQQFGTLVFLHELSHIAGAGSAIDEGNAYNNKIVAQCIK
jgi:RHS repeat-associated protein